MPGEAGVALDGDEVPERAGVSQFLGTQEVERAGVHRRRPGSVGGQAVLDVAATLAPVGRGQGGGQVPALGGAGGGQALGRGRAGVGRAPEEGEGIGAAQTARGQVGRLELGERVVHGGVEAAPVHGLGTTAPDPHLIPELLNQARDPALALGCRGDDGVAGEVGDVRPRDLLLDPGQRIGGDASQLRVVGRDEGAEAGDSVLGGSGGALDHGLQGLGVGQAVDEGGELAADALLVVGAEGREVEERIDAHDG